MTRRLLCLLFLLIHVVASSAANPQYIASRLRAPFHYLTCSSAKRMTAEHAVYFDTRDQAIAAGHRPCKVCDP